MKISNKLSLQSNDSSRSELLKAFTLVELIVVIVILAILTTIASLNFGSQVSSSRDSVRVIDITNLSKGLLIQSVKTGSYPLPDSYINISSGTVIGYQGEVGTTVKSILNANGFNDPLDKTNYTYTTNTTQDRYQLVAFLENKDSITFRINPIPNLYAATSYTNRYPFVIGDALGIILSASGTTYTPINNVLSPGESFDTKSTAENSGSVVVINNITEPIKAEFVLFDGYTGTGSSGPEPATCGQNAITYNFSSGAFLGATANDFCTSSNSILSGGVNPSFPTAGSNVSWTCNSIKGGVSASCTATRNSSTAVNPVVNTVISATNVNSGNALSTSTISGTFKVSDSDSTTVAGTLVWTTPTTILNATGNQSWTFTPTNLDLYNVITGTVNVTVITLEYFPGLDGVTGGGDDCDTPNITIGTQVWSACNVGATKASLYTNCLDVGTCTSNIVGNYYKWAEAMNTGATANDNQYIPTLPAKGICPSGWHVPSRSEFDTAISIYGNTTYGNINNLATVLKMPRAGYIFNTTYYYQGNWGRYWSSTPESGIYSNSFSLNFDSSSLLSYGSYSKHLKFPVRCLKN